MNNHDLKNENLNKNDVRKLMLERRRALTAVQIRTASDRIFETFAGLRAVHDSKCVLSYMPYGNEADAMPLNRARAFAFRESSMTMKWTQ